MKIKRFLDIEQQLQSRIKLRANEIAEIERMIVELRADLKNPEYYFFDDDCGDVSEAVDEMCRTAARMQISVLKQMRKGQGKQQTLDKSLMKVYRAVLSDVRIHQKNGYPIVEVF